MNNQNLFKYPDEYTAYNKIRYFGNKAAHPGFLNEKIKPYHYDNKDIIEILGYFNMTMKYLDRHAEKRI